MKAQIMGFFWLNNTHHYHERRDKTRMRYCTAKIKKTIVFLQRKVWVKFLRNSENVSFDGKATQPWTRRSRIGKH